MANDLPTARSAAARFLLFFAFLLATPPSWGAASALFTEITIHADDVRHPVHAELALDRASWVRGLMARETLTPGTGMLFLYHMDRSIAIWMKNVPIPLDVVFLAADGTVVDVYPDRPPWTKRTVSPRRPVRATLELPGGTTRTWGLKPGDRMTPTPEALRRQYPSTLPQ